MPLIALLAYNVVSASGSSGTLAAASTVQAEPAAYNTMRVDSVSRVKAHLASYETRKRAAEQKRKRERQRARRRAIRHSSVAWAHTSDAIKVSNCESGGPRDAKTYQGNVHDRYNPNYRGKWQIGYSEYHYFGGHGDPADASEAEQDYRAWRYWMRSGWRPWECASIMGVS